jgi:CheY-like chemotaxis protein
MGPIARQAGTVLLVDDEEILLEVVKELLRSIGYRVLVARDGEEAIQIHRKYRNDIDIVLLDMMMPNMGGGETYDRMKEMNPEIRVLLSSGFGVDGGPSKILERGCDGFIQKPFTINELSDKLREIFPGE